MSINQAAQAQSSSAHTSSSDVPPYSKKEADLWTTFYERINDPVIAAILVAKLDSDPKARRAHTALYICAEETLCRQQMRMERFTSFGRLIGTTARRTTSLLERAYRTVVEEITATKRAIATAARSEKNQSPDPSFDLLLMDARVAASLYSLFAERPDLMTSHPLLYAKVISAVQAEKLAKSA